MLDFLIGYIACQYRQYTASPTPRTYQHSHKHSYCPVGHCGPTKVTPCPCNGCAQASLCLLGRVAVFSSAALTKPTQKLQAFPSLLSGVLPSSTHSPA